MSIPTPREIDVSLDDIPPDFAAAIADGDSAPLRCEEPGCENVIVKPPRGRTPKRCVEHRKGGTAAKTAKPRSFTGAEQMEQVLTGYLSGFGYAIQMLNPADGQVIAKGAGPVAHELVELAKTDKKLRDFLEKIVTPGKYGGLFKACFPIAIGIAANHGMFTFFAPKPNVVKFPEGGRTA